MNFQTVKEHSKWVEVAKVLTEYCWKSQEGQKNCVKRNLKGLIGLMESHVMFGIPAEMKVGFQKLFKRVLLRKLKKGQLAMAKKKTYCS